MNACRHAEIRRSRCERNWRGSSATAAFRGSWSVPGSRPPWPWGCAARRSSCPPCCLPRVRRRRPRGADARMGPYPQRRLCGSWPWGDASSCCFSPIRFSGGCEGRSAAIKSCWPTLRRRATTGRPMPKSCSAWLARPSGRRRSPLPWPSESGRVRLNFQGELPCFWTRISASSPGPAPLAVSGLGTPCDLGGGLLAGDASAGNWERGTRPRTRGRSGATSPTPAETKTAAPAKAKITLNSLGFSTVRSGSGDDPDLDKIIKEKKYTFLKTFEARSGEKEYVYHLTYPRRPPGKQEFLSALGKRHFLGRLPEEGTTAE